MENVSLQDLLLAGTHFGHLTRRWNPKMKKFIFMERHGIYIIDLKKTLVHLQRACEEVTRVAQAGEKILFVGTKKQAKDIIKAEALRCGMFYVNERWLGGTLTNFSTVKKSIKRLKSYEKMAMDGTYEKISKKEILQNEREKEKLEKVLGGIKDLTRLPGLIFVVDPKKESIAIQEANRLDIPVVSLIDTNADPDVINFPIPGNDDAFKSINLITRTIADAAIDGTKQMNISAAEAEAMQDKLAAEQEEAEKEALLKRKLDIDEE